MSKIKWKYTEKEISREYIEKVGIEFGIQFPNDYIECAIYNHGANAEPNCFDLGNNQKIFAGLLSFNEESMENIMEVYSCIKKALPNKVIPFGCDPSGNYICFDYSESEINPRIVFWYHEIAVTKENLDEFEEEILRYNTLENLQRKTIYYIDDSFTHFINSLY